MRVSTTDRYPPIRSSKTPLEFDIAPVGGFTEQPIGVFDGVRPVVRFDESERILDDDRPIVPDPVHSGVCRGCTDRFSVAEYRVCEPSYDTLGYGSYRETRHRLGISEMPEPRCEERSVVGGCHSAGQLDVGGVDLEFVEGGLGGALAGD